MKSGSSKELPNSVDEAGWTFVTERDPSGQLVHLRVVVRSGRVSDPANAPGLAHFTARALLRGTRARAYAELNESIESLGATLQVVTDQSETFLSATVLRENLAPFLGILEEILTQPAFDPAEMEKLRGIVQGELKADLQTPRVLAARALMGMMYKDTPLALPAEGSVESVSRITVPQVEEFFRAKYVRENMVVAISTAMDAKDLASAWSAAFRRVPHGRLDAPALPAPVLTGRRAIVVDRKGMGTSPLFIAAPGVRDGDADRPALELANFVFGSDFTSRLVQVLRVENGWTYGAYSGFEQLIGPKRDAGLFSLYTYPAAEHFAKAAPKALELLQTYVDEGVTDDEFKDARDSLSNSYPFETDTVEKRLTLKLRAQLTDRSYVDLAQYRKLLAGLTKTQVNALVGERTKLDHLGIVAVGEASALVPVLSALPGVVSVDVVDVKP